MIRLFREHEARRVYSLDGLWQLQTENRALDLKALVPGVWERLPELADWRGVATYSRNVRLEADGPVLLRFGGVSHTAEVLWDGETVGRHYNAFTGFEVLLMQASAGEHLLQVQVDNRFTEASTLHIPNDYMTYGGITRPVEMHLLRQARIAHMTFRAEETDAGSFSVSLEVELQALADCGPMLLSACVAGTGAECDVPPLRRGEIKTLHLSFDVNGIERWCPANPRLYTLDARLRADGCTVDDLRDRVGFRTIKVEGTRIELNRRPVKILGFNRHEDHGQLGCAMTPELMEHDLQLMRSMGANAVRTCHYPNDARFLDLCDEMGFMVWEEHHARALPGEILRKPLFSEQIAKCNEEMIRQHANHPSICMWGVLNECETETEFGRELYARNLGQLRKLDPTRPVTFATCRHYTDLCLDLPDIVSWNIYPQWYEDEPAAEFLRRLLAWSDAHGAAGRPVLISEIGAGAIPGYHDPLRRGKWSEERQADILRDQLRAVLADKRVSGVFIWQFADVRVDEEWAMRRPRTMNNKGVVDEYRRPKMCCEAVRDIFTRESGENVK